MDILFLVIITSICIAFLVYKDRQYKKTAYYLITKNPYSSIKYDVGKFGEYLIYKRLKHLEVNGAKFLFNIYLPKDNGQTTEIDVILIHPSGLFVLESKNYGGWIFGNEFHQNWTQTFPQGRGNSSRKERFYNPIMQNASHIRHLKHFLDKDVPIYSIIVFSDRCTLRNVTVKSNDVRLVRCGYVAQTIDQICGQQKANSLNEMEIDDIYTKLYLHTQISHEDKMRHAENLQNYLIRGTR